jgi:hypothetical protein
MSSPVYLQRGATARDPILVQDASGAFVTGLVDADFTKRMTKDGAHIATAGVTITEINSVTHPGEYDVALDGATGIPAAYGTYSLILTRTAAPIYTYEQVYIVSASTSPATVGVAFTATAADGRAYDGAAAVAGATVVITNAGGTLIATDTTDASGLWGPIYFVTDGVYTVLIQKSGYTSVSSTLTVAGGATTVTGPGIDLTLTASATDPLLASELWAYFTRQARDVSGVKATAERQQGVQDALDMLAKERQWRWYLRKAYLTLRAPYTTGTITLTNGSATVTLAGGTVPAWVTEGDRLLVGNRFVEVVARVDDNTFTIGVAWAEASTTAGFSLIRDAYDLPNNMLWMHKLIPGPRWGWGGSAVAPEQFYEQQSAVIFGQKFSSCWTIHHGQLLLYPYPTEATELSYTYYAKPAALTSGADLADWDPAHVEVLRRAIDYQVAVRYGSCAGGDKNASMASYKEALARAAGSERDPTSVAGAMDDLNVWDRSNRTDWHRRS